MSTDRSSDTGSRSIHPGTGSTSFRLSAPVGRCRRCSTVFRARDTASPVGNYRPGIRCRTGKRTVRYPQACMFPRGDTDEGGTGRGSRSSFRDTQTGTDTGSGIQKRNWFPFQTRLPTRYRFQFQVPSLFQFRNRFRVRNWPVHAQSTCRRFDTVDRRTDRDSRTGDRNFRWDRRNGSRSAGR